MNNLMSNRCNYMKHGDMAVINLTVYQSLQSEEEINRFLERINCKRLSVLKKIKSNGVRTPEIELIRGSDPWVIHVDNGIKYRFNVTKSMFSFGNIKEKIRISKMDCSSEIIVDLYCGVGYFALQFLVHTNAKKVIAIDWNPDAIEALKENLVINKVDHRCDVYLGDNRLICPVQIADRVHLGLIPTSKESWKTACMALNPLKGGILHIHENVNSFECKGKVERNAKWCQWADSVSNNIGSIFKTIYPDSNWTISVVEFHKIKSYAPHIDHMVADISCKPEV